LLEVALSNTAVELRAALFDAIEKGRESARRGALVDIEDDRQVRPAVAGCNLTDSEDVRDGQSPGGALVGERRTREAIGENEFAAIERGNDALFEELGAARHVQQHLAAHCHRVIRGIEEDASDVFADARAARFADLGDDEPLGLTALGEAAKLRALPAPVGTVEDHETAAKTGLQTLPRGSGAATPRAVWLPVRLAVGRRVWRHRRRTSVEGRVHLPYHRVMRIDVREPDRDNSTPWTSPRIARIEVDPVARPNLIRLPAASPAPEAAADAPTTAQGTPEQPPQTAPRDQGSDRFLNWEGALDDGGHLRKCLICGCDHLYRQKTLPQVTPFVALLAFAGAIIGLLGYSNNPLMLPVLVGLLVIDIATLALASERLICYRCGSVYSKLRIARYHRRWDRTEAERVRARSAPSGNSVASPPGS
jgi:hypothetical protein